jgi:hypothetical protein
MAVIPHTQAQAARELATRPRRLRRAIAAHAGLLLPGRYLPTDLATLAVHESAVASDDHLAQTVRGMSARLADNGLVRLSYGAAGRVVERATATAVSTLTGSLIVSGGQGTAIALKLTADGAVLVVDPARGLVTRMAAAAVYDETYQQLRDRFASCVPTPDYQVAYGGLRLVERYVLGTAFAQASPHVKEQTTREVLRHLCALVEREAALPKPHHTAEGLSVVSHGDLTTENIILDGSDYRVIDLVALGIRPYWYDTIAFLATADPVGLVSGAYDDALGVLHEASGGSGSALRGNALQSATTGQLPPGARRALARRSCS